MSESHFSNGYAFPFLLLLALFPVKGMATNQGQGRVSVQGSIIDTPCAIDVSDREQTIELATIPVGQIIRDGQGPEKPFSIRLVNCTLKGGGPHASEWTSFQITFDGPTTRDDLFSVQGAARGVGLQISDPLGAVALPGKAMSAGNILPGTMQLDYRLRLMSNRDSLRAGAYQTTIRFKLDYF